MILMDVVHVDQELLDHVVIAVCQTTMTLETGAAGMCLIYGQRYTNTDLATVVFFI